MIHHISLPPGRLSGDAIERLFTNRLTARDEPSLACLRDLRVSTHFLIRRRGELLQFAGCGQRAWHAGVSRFRNRERCNDFSIGIELEGTGEVPYTDSQYRRLAQLVPLMCTTYPLKWVAGHSDIAPGRKYDPGPSFDWSRIAPVLKASALMRPF